MTAHAQKGQRPQAPKVRPTGDELLAVMATQVHKPG